MSHNMNYYTLIVTQEIKKNKRTHINNNIIIIINILTIISLI